MRVASGQKGFTLAEFMGVLAIAAVLLLVSVPALMNIFGATQSDAAALQIAAAAREARSRAVATGWQYRLHGYGKQASPTLRNQYRFLARTTSAAGWPADTSAPFTSTTQFAGPWISLESSFRGIDVNPASSANGGRFLVSFDSRGSPFETEVFQPLTVTSTSGASHTVQVSTTGTVTVQ